MSHTTQPACRQNEGRQCTVSELLTPLLDVNIDKGYMVSAQGHEVHENVSLFNYSPSHMSAYNPSLFVHNGQLRAFLRIDFNLGSLQKCPPHHITNSSKCPGDGSEILLYSALAHVKLDRRQGSITMDSDERGLLKNRKLWFAVFLRCVRARIHVGRRGLGYIHRCGCRELPSNVCATCVSKRDGPRAPRPALAVARLMS